MAAGMASARVGLSDQEWLGFWHGAISGFKNPSYTYVIRVDIKDWRVHERAIMDIYSKDGNALRSSHPHRCEQLRVQPQNEFYFLVALLI